MLSIASNGNQNLLGAIFIPKIKEATIMMKHTTESTKEYLGLKSKRKTTPKLLKDFSHADIKKTLDYIGITREKTAD